MKNQYVILTGSKNNAGDFLIKYRAKALFKIIRPDRDIVDLNGWESFDDYKLQTINESRALILMGGPSLVKNMVPNVYNLEEYIDAIKVPVILMGVGWKSKRGNWEDTYNYDLNRPTLKLLNKVKGSEFLSSVRDYHTLNVLRFKGIENVLMTGCPAYYDYKYLNKDFAENKIEKVSFSLGVSFIESPSMFRLMKENVLECKKHFKGNFEVVFHHSLNRKDFKDKHKKISKHVLKHNQFADWLDENNIKYIDISGSAKNLINYYSNVDLHIGYRVHAHIFMNSISKKSILICEDGRAKGVKGSINGIVLKGFLNFKNKFHNKVLNKLIPNYDKFKSNLSLSKELVSEIEYEKRINFSRMKNSRKIIDSNYKVMFDFLNQLP